MSDYEEWVRISGLETPIAKCLHAKTTEQFSTLVNLSSTGYFVELKGVRFSGVKKRNVIVQGYIKFVPKLGLFPEQRQELLRRYIVAKTGSISGANKNPSLLEGYEEGLDLIVDTLATDSFFRFH